ncbi:MAG TPA: glycosyltransferase family 1 protein [Terriglobales bacterium]|nr:glycosyltransferase family 1 protein [Terriglobales bacterium]
MKSKPVIALDFRWFDGLNMGCGQYRYSVDLIRALARLQPEAEFVLLASRPEPVPELRDIFHTPLNGWRYRQVSRRRSRRSYYLDHLQYGWVLRRERVNLLHALHTFIPIFSPCPVVVTQYDMMFELFPEYAEACRSRPYRIHKWLSRNRVHHIICISETTAADLRNLWGIPQDKMSVIYLGTELPNGSAMDLSLPQKFGLSSNDRIVLSPYNLEPRKNLASLLQAVARLRPRYNTLRLVLCGRAAVTEDREREFSDLVRQLDLTDRVMKTGFIANEELIGLYQMATIFVFPSLYEGFGLPVLEAMAAGVCVIARDASAMAEVLGNTGELVETKAPESLANAITRLLDDPTLRRRLGDAARERAAMFTTARMAQRTYEAYLIALNS